MPVFFSMPKLGLNMTQGVIVRWLVGEGDQVEPGKPVLEIETDKATQELEAPGAGFLARILKNVGDIVPCNEVIAVILAPGEPMPTSIPVTIGDGIASKIEPTLLPSTNEVPQAEETRINISPVARVLAEELGVDISKIVPHGGRIKREDVLAAHEAQKSQLPKTPISETRTAGPSLRKKIAERMVESKRTSAHVHSVFAVDMSRVIAVRQKEKNDYERRTGTRLTMMPFFCRAAIEAMRAYPIINASVEGDNIRYHRNVNLGIAVALDWGLIVPVIKHAEELNFLGIQRAILDLADRARSKKLKPDEVAGGTFTITNPGQYGQMFGLPIIMQPQVAILGVGSVKKEPVVVTDENGQDSIAIRSIGHISLGYDHRVVDGAVADQFLRDTAKYLENWNEPLG